MSCKLITNKNAFQLKAHPHLANRKSHNLTLEYLDPEMNNLIYDLDLRHVEPSLTDVQVAKWAF